MPTETTDAPSLREIIASVMQDPEVVERYRRFQCRWAMGRDRPIETARLGSRVVAWEEGEP